MVKFQFLAQFPVEHLAHSLLSSLILFLCKFAAFADYVIDWLIIIIIIIIIWYICPLHVFWTFTSFSGDLTTKFPLSFSCFLL